jgi:hypothetical protein
MNLVESLKRYTTVVADTAARWTRLLASPGATC